MLTVSSTAALEAVGAGVRTAFIAELDVREQLGNHIFLGSGLLRTFDQLEIDDVGVPARSWIEDYFFDTHAVTPAPGPPGSVRLPDGSFLTASSCSCARPGPGAKPYVGRPQMKRKCSGCPRRVRMPT